MVKYTSIRAMLAMVAYLDMQLEQMDVKIAFSHGNLEERLYMEHLEGFSQSGHEHLIYKLRKSLYGLK